MTAGGEERRVGVELEFAGVSTEAASSLVRDLFGGELRPLSRHRHEVVGADLGDFKIELDFKYAHRSESDPPLISASVDAELRGFLGDLGQGLLPLEIVCPPIRISQAHRLEPLIDGLRSKGATGGERGLIYAFAAQLNPEMAGADAAYLLRVLRAFMLLRDWLRDEIRPDISRRFLAFAKPFPADYMRLVLDPAYAPDVQRFIADYIEANPSRNMELDLLPALRWLDERAVVSRLPGETINARPAFHYRLPNFRLGEESWSLRSEWERWLKVERLASSGATLERLSREWLRTDRESLINASLINTWLPASRAVAAML